MLFQRFIHCYMPTKYLLLALFQVLEIKSRQVGRLKINLVAREGRLVQTPQAGDWSEAVMMELISD